MKTQTQETVEERLRASKSQHETEIRAQGREAGKEWAQTHAEFIELKRLEKLCETHQIERTWDSFLDPLDPYGNSIYTGAEQLAAAILGMETPDRNDCGEFQELFFGKELAESPEALDAFCEGALEVFDGVKDKL